MGKFRRECLEICRREGLPIIGVEQRGRHWAALPDQGSPLFLPCTPSDWRTLRIIRAEVRRRVRARASDHRGAEDIRICA